MPIDQIIMVLISFGASTISGIAGMAGGILLLGGMTFFMPLQQIVPIHGVVQLTSNTSRTFFLRRYIHKQLFLNFLIGSPIGGLLGYFLISKVVSSEWVLAIIALLLLYVAFKPKILPSIKLPACGYFILGIIACCLGMLIGATGPLLAPFFAREDLTKEEIVSTKAACQILIHLVKIPVFIALAFSYSDYLLLILAMSFAAVLGSRFGTLILQKASTKIFWRILKVVCVLIAARLLFVVLTAQ